MDAVTIILTFALVSHNVSLPTGLLSAVCYVESKHKVDAMHLDDGNSNSVGICQIKLSTARWLGFKGTEADLKNPKTNIHYAAKYLKYQLKRYGNDINKAISAYNAGSFKKSNHKYVNKVITAWGKAK